MVLDEDIGSSVLAYSAGHVSAGVIDVKFLFCILLRSCHPTNVLVCAAYME